MAILDDVCASQHGVREGADANLKAKLRDNCRGNKHFQDIAEGFAIHHYAGVVNYNVDGFVERNKDTFNNDLVPEENILLYRITVLFTYTTCHSSFFLRCSSLS